MKLKLNDKTYDVEVTDDGVIVDGETFRTMVDGAGGMRIVTVNGRPVRVDLAKAAGGLTDVTVEGQVFEASIEDTAPARPVMAISAPPRPVASVRAAAPAAPATAGVKGAVTAQMTGRIVRVAVQAGDTVAAGDLLLILEAMKMENEIRSSRAGTVKEVLVAPGDRVNIGHPLIALE